MTLILTATASAQSLDLTPFAGNWKGALHQVDMQLNLPIKLTVYKTAMKGGIAARSVIIAPNGTCNADYVVNEVTGSTMLVTMKVTSGPCVGGDIQFPLSKNAAGKALLGHTAYLVPTTGQVGNTPNLTGTMWRY